MKTILDEILENYKASRDADIVITSTTTTITVKTEASPAKTTQLTFASVCERFPDLDRGSIAITLASLRKAGKLNEMNLDSPELIESLKPQTL